MGAYFPKIIDFSLCKNPENGEVSIIGNYQMEGQAHYFHLITFADIDALSKFADMCLKFKESCQSKIPSAYIKAFYKDDDQDNIGANL